MTPQDELLLNCNETELLEIARRQGLGRLRRGLGINVLASIVSGDVVPDQSHYAGTDYTRKKLEVFIDSQWDVVRSQLPGCDGKCTTFPCSDGKHAMCFLPNADSVQ